MKRPLSAELNLAREEQFASQSWEALEFGNPVYDLVRKYADVFPDKIRIYFCWSWGRFKVLRDTAVAVA